MKFETPFKWRHFQSEIILLNVRWYLRYRLSYRNLEEMMVERGLSRQEQKHAPSGRSRLATTICATRCAKQVRRFPLVN